MMGVDSKEALYDRMKEAGCEPPVLELSKKKVRFGGSTDMYRAQMKITF